MRRALVLVIAMAVMASCSSGSGTKPPPAQARHRCGAIAGGDAKAILACVEPALAFVETPIGTGSGVLVEGGYVVTNAHVVDPMPVVDLVFEGGHEFEDVPVLGIDPIADIAVVGPVDIERRPLEIISADGLEKGDDVFLVGFPGEVDEDPEPAISRGILSRLRTARGFDLEFLQTDAAIGGGQSGGALADPRGRVVGISGFSFAEEFALALSGPDVMRAVRLILDGRSPPYRPFPLEGGVTSGAFELRDSLDTHLLTLRTAAKPVTVTLTLPADSRPALMVVDLAGTNTFFMNDEARKLTIDQGFAEPGDLPPADEAVAPGVFEFEIPEDRYAVMIVGTAHGDGRSIEFESSVPLAPYDGDPPRDIKLGQRLLDDTYGLQLDGDRFRFEAARSGKVQVSVTSPSGDMGFLFTREGEEPDLDAYVDDAPTGAGLFGLDAIETFEVEAGAVYVIEVATSDGFGSGYAIEVTQA